jgi:hypothetical protein
MAITSDVGPRAILLVLALPVALEPVDAVRVVR